MSEEPKPVKFDKPFTCWYCERKFYGYFYVFLTSSSEDNKHWYETAVCCMDCAKIYSIRSYYV